MTLPNYPSSISLYQTNIELGRPGGQTIGMNDSGVRSLAGVPSGAIQMYQLYGKSAVTVSITLTFSQSGPFYARSDRCLFGISVTGGTATAYSWSQSCPSASVFSGSTGSTYDVRGPGYDLNGSIGYDYGTAYCAVTVGGVVYYPTYDFSVQVPNNF